jgi:fluoroquinolone transport system permease protein
MRYPASMIRWYLLLDYRYRIIHVALLTVILWTLVLQGIPFLNTGRVVAALLFLDPTILGFVFIGALVLFEKSDRSLEALTVTPMRVGAYLLTHIATLTTISVIASLVLVVLNQGIFFSYLYFFIGVILTSVLFILVGFIAVSRFSSVNEYFITAAVYTAIFNIPLIHHFGLAESWVFYLFPTQASLLLLTGIFEPLALWEVGYAILMLSASIGISYLFAKRMFYTHIILGGS